MRLKRLVTLVTLVGFGLQMYNKEPFRKLLPLWRWNLGAFSLLDEVLRNPDVWIPVGAAMPEAPGWCQKRIILLAFLENGLDTQRSGGRKLDVR